MNFSEANDLSPFFYSRCVVWKKDPSWHLFFCARRRLLNPHSKSIHANNTPQFPFNWPLTVSLVAFQFPLLVVINSHRRYLLVCNRKGTPRWHIIVIPWCTCWLLNLDFVLHLTMIANISLWTYRSTNTHRLDRSSSRYHFHSDQPLSFLIQFGSGPIGQPYLYFLNYSFEPYVCSGPIGQT